MIKKSFFEFFIYLKYLILKITLYNCIFNILIINLGGLRSIVSLTDDDRHALVNAANLRRAAVQPKAANMKVGFGRI